VGYVFSFPKEGILTLGIFPWFETTTQFMDLVDEAIRRGGDRMGTPWKINGWNLQPSPI